MTTATIAVPPDADTDRDLPGQTTMAARAVEHIATQAITEIADVGGTKNWLLGEALATSAEERSAEVSAVVDETTAALRVRLSIAYPASVTRTTERVRAHLVHRLHELTGLTVTRVDIAVTALYLARSGHRRVQ